MYHRPALMEVAWGKSTKGAWHVLVGWQGTWIQVAGPFKLKRECYKAVTAVARKFRGHRHFHAAARKILNEFLESPGM